MKYIFTLILFISVLTIPSQAQTDADLSKDITALREDIKNLEAEIAEARVSYPEDVPELEKELAVTKKMLAAFEKMAGMSSASPSQVASTVPPVKPTVSSPIVAIYLNQPVKAPTPDQATDHLLWYTGKKINDTTLVTTRAMVVQFQPSKNRVVSKPESRSDLFKHLVEELEKSEQRKDELIDKFIKMKNGTLYYPSLINSLKVYDDIEERYDKAAKNTIDVPDLGLSKPNYRGIENVPSRRPSIGEANNNEHSDELDEIFAKIKAEEKRADRLEAQLPPVDQFPAPPRKEIGICASCDPDIVEREKMEDEKWQKEFMAKETEIIRLRLSIARAYALMGMDDYNFNSGTLMNRMSIKVKLLYDRYGKNFEYAKTVVPLVLSVERQKQLLGVEEQSGISSDLSSMLAFDYTKLLKEQMDLKNYNFALDISQHLGFERQKQLLGAADEEDGTISTVEMAMKFNRFALTLDLGFIYEQVDHDGEFELKATGSISTKEKVYVRLYPDSCSWRMILHDADYNNAGEQLKGIPLRAKSGEKTVRDDDDNLVTFSHTGQKDMLSYLPEFNINLCDISKMDSAFMMVINFPYGYIAQVDRDLNKSYKDEMLPIANHLFIDINKMEDNASEGMDLAADIVATISESNITNPTGNPKLDMMQHEYNTKVIQDDHKKDLSRLGMNKKSVFLFNANNGSTVFIDQTNDTKHQIDENTKLTKGLIHLRVVHESEEK